MVIRELLVRLGVDADDDALDDFDDALGRVMESASRLGKILAAQAAAYAAVGTAATAAATNLLEYSEEVIRNAEAMGLATDKYQGFRFAFKNLNASTDDMMDAFSTITDRAVDALEGTESYRKEFDRLGISMDQLRNKEPGRIFETYMNAAQEAEGNTEAVTAAVRLFGDDLGRRILPALTSSSESFSQLMHRAEKAGVIISREELEKARNLRMEYRELTGRLNAIWRTVGIRVLPVFAEFLRKFQDFLDSAQESEGIFDAVSILMRNWAEDVRVAMEMIEDLTDMLSDDEGKWTDNVELAIQSIKLLAGVLTAAFAGALGYAIAGLVGTLTVGMAVAAAKAAAIAAVLYTIYLVFEDIYVFLKGGNSVIGQILDRFGEGSGMLDAFVQMIEAAKGPLTTVWKRLKLVGSYLIPMIVSGLKMQFSVVINVLKAVFQTIFVLVEAAFGFVKVQLDLFTGIVKGLWQLLTGNWEKGLQTLFATLIQWGRNIVAVFMNLAKGLLEMVSNLFWSVISDMISSLSTMLSAIPGGIGESVAKELDEAAKATDYVSENLGLGGDFKMKSRKEITSNRSRQPPLSMPSERKLVPVRGGMSTMVGGRSPHRPAPKQSTNNQMSVQNNITVEGEVSSKTKQRIDDSVDEANRSAKATFEGGPR